MKYLVRIPYAGEITMEIDAHNREDAEREAIDTIDGWNPSYCLHAMGLQRQKISVARIEEEPESHERRGYLPERF